MQLVIHLQTTDTLTINYLIMYIKISTILIAIATGVLLPGCGKSASARSAAVEAVEKSDSLSKEVKQLVKAIAEGDSSAFAGLVSYPLKRPYPLHDIESADEMMAYYHNLVDDSLRNIIKSSGPDRWGEYGWRGWTLDDGQYVWIDESVYDVQYLSQREKNMIDSLTNAEVSNIAPSIREGWKPVLCLENSSDKTIYRVDVRTKDNPIAGRHYRLAIYPHGIDLKGVPPVLVEGVMETEGSAGDILYRFGDKSSGEYVLEPEATDNMNPLMWLPGGDASIELNRTYWHDIISKSK